MGQRGSEGGGEHEASRYEHASDRVRPCRRGSASWIVGCHCCDCDVRVRRMKTEILIQMDGLSKTSDLVFVLAASNLPWYANGVRVMPGVFCIFGCWQCLA